MIMKNKNMEKLRLIAAWIHLNYSKIEDYFVQKGAVLFVIDGKHRFLGYRDWAWDLQDKSEIAELLDDNDLFYKPRGVAKYYVARALCEKIWRRKVLREVALTAPVPRRPGSKIAEYREDLRQYIQNTYYPI